MIFLTTKSVQNINYIVETCPYIDEGWVLNKKNICSLVRTLNSPKIDSNRSNYTLNMVINWFFYSLQQPAAIKFFHSFKENYFHHNSQVSCTTVNKCPPIPIYSSHQWNNHPHLIH
jgi:hypothetical protein